MSWSGLDETLPASIRRELSEALEPRALAAGETLCREGESGDGLYLLNEGRLEIRVRVGADEARVDRVEAPAVVGEAAMLTGRPRTATVAALEDSTLQFLPRAAFARLAERHPALVEQLETEVRPRLRRTRLAQLLRARFGEAHEDTIRSLQAALPWLERAGGEPIFREGDPADGAYLVVSGRVRLYRAGRDGPLPAGEVSPGESLGETSMLTDAPHGVTALALRDSVLAHVTRDVAERHPPLLGMLARSVAERSQRRDGARPRSRPPSTLALVPLDAHAPASALTGALEEALRPYGSTLRIDRAELARRFAGSEVADSDGGRVEEVVLRDWLDRREREHEHLLYLADVSASTWTERCLRQADRVVLVARADAEPHGRAWEARLAEVAPHTPVDLVLVHEDTVERPERTWAWLAGRELRLHHHVRLGRPRDVRRLARHLSGRATTLVLSGGGARGYAHIGLLGALEAAGVEVDAVAGTSIGALVGAAYAREGSVDFAERSARAFGDRRRILDRTLPIVAIARSRGFNRILRSMFGDGRIEDAWIPFVCVSSNLSRAEPALHVRGPTWRAVRASSAIPGIFPPLLHDGELLVDGGVMNNLPVDVARDLFGDGPLIASNAYPLGEQEPPYLFGDDVDGWALLAQRLLPRARRRVRAPSIMATLMRATSLHGKALMKSVADDADLLVRHPTRGVGGLDFDRVDELIALGRARGERALASDAGLRFERAPGSE